MVSRVAIVSVCALVCTVAMLASFPGWVQATSCISDACTRVQCPPVPADCQPGERLENGGECLCCKFCKKVVGEGEFCGSNIPFIGQSANNLTCAEGLRCVDEHCAPDAI